MEPDAREREALRQRLYRPGASTTDLASYLDAAEPERPEPEPPVTARAVPSAGRRLVTVGAAVVLALTGAVVVGVLARSPGVAPTAAPTASAARSTDRTPSDGAPLPMLDEGTRPHATGRAVREPPHDYLYTIARGDTVTAIAQRFRLCAADIYGALPYGASTERLPPSQQLLLQGHTLDPADYAVPGAC
jgi:hypothetical protein